MKAEPIMDVLDAVEGVRERPILFAAPMVRAILAGTKTQTRRVVKPQPPVGTEEVSSYHHPADEDGRGPRFWSWSNDQKRPHGFFIDGKWHQPCPYGKTGDRLWVRETVFINHFMGLQIPEAERADCDLHYRATDEVGMQQWEDLEGLRWTPSIHMPRWASRITLNVTGVRVERLQAISEDDARAEGITDGGCLNCGNPELSCGCLNPRPDARDSFVHLWKSINGAESWDANPWVWVVSFQRIAS